MKQSNNRVKGLINNIITGGVEHYDIEVMRKIKMINIMSIIAMAILIPFGTVDLIQGSHAVGLFVLVISVILLFNQYYLRKSGNYAVPIYCGISIVALYFLYALATGALTTLDTCGTSRFHCSLYFSLALRGVLLQQYCYYFHL